MDCKTLGMGYYLFHIMELLSALLGIRLLLLWFDGLGCFYACGQWQWNTREVNGGWQNSRCPPAVRFPLMGLSQALRMMVRLVGVPFRKHIFVEQSCESTQPVIGRVKAYAKLKRTDAADFPTSYA